MDRAISETLKRPEFTWKLPRQPEPTATQKKWPFVAAIERLVKATGRAIKRVFDTIGKWVDKLFGRRAVEPKREEAGAWQGVSRFTLILLLVVLGLIALLMLALTLSRVRLRRGTAAGAARTPAPINIEDEHLTADLLPEDEWLALAREHLGRGEVRLALRAFFLAGLAHLATREVLLLARHKSNREYLAELQRKARDQAQLLDAFRENTAAVERVWYGQHEIDREELARFEANLELIRAC